MKWDEALLRKFSSTGHFRLLNQVRTELKAQPISRDPETKKLTVQVKPFKGVAMRVNRRPNALEGKENEDLQQEEGPSSFRDRLNSIELC
ncbi:hypothetical protein [Prochlorococcus sp. MIT 1300]|uniref:hypothetical protein n=1 Tax=Prochlorococcus sp. MIT 1300 TaxID=3096218 RepID=UPI002A762288|nr:hypothetical protein [Prochlorococcus sp. MIT 1300]